MKSTVCLNLDIVYLNIDCLIFFIGRPDDGNKGNDCLYDCVDYSAYVVWFLHLLYCFVNTCIHKDKHIAAIYQVEKY